MKEQMLTNLNAVIAALNTVSVSGEQNLANLGGSITVLRAMVEAIVNAPEPEPATGNSTDNEAMKEER